MKSIESFSPGPAPDTVRKSDGSVVPVPAGWMLLPPGDPGVTRRVKEAGDHWVICEKAGRRTLSKGVWASAQTIERIRAELEIERATPGYAKRKDADARRRKKTQENYTEDFHAAVLAFLCFHPDYREMGQRLARAVTDHATPIGSGTVARTRRIPIEHRAEAAVIAWMRHQTTGYDNMPIARIKGKRREVRRMLAKRSHELLDKYRRGNKADIACPLKAAIDRPPARDKEKHAPDVFPGPWSK